MSERNDWNAKIIDEFRANAGKVGGPFEGANVKAHPDVTVEVGTDTVEVHARVAEGEERERIWTRQKQLMPGFAEYEQKPARQSPVIVLERV